MASFVCKGYCRPCGLAEWALDAVVNPCDLIPVMTAVGPDINRLANGGARRCYALADRPPMAIKSYLAPCACTVGSSVSAKLSMGLKVSAECGTPVSQFSARLNLAMEQAGGKKASMVVGNEVACSGPADNVVCQVCWPLAGRLCRAMGYRLTNCAL